MAGKKRPNGYWNNPENLYKEIDRFFQENSQYKELPSQRVLFSLGYSALTRGINQNGGFREVRTKLGHKNGEKVKKGDWKDLEYTLREAREIMKKLDVVTFPNEIYLRKNGYSSICNAINRYHGGTISFRKLLGEKTRNSPGTWESLEFCLEHAKIFLSENQEYSTLPSI